MEKPKTRFILFGTLFIIEIIVIAYLLLKKDFLLSWNEFFPGTFFAQSMFALSFGLNYLAAFIDMKNKDKSGVL
jgi:hypothetical protein